MSARTTARHVKPTQWNRRNGADRWLLACPAQATELYRLSSTNTQVAFFVQHLGFQFVNARFSDINGDSFWTGRPASRWMSRWESPPWSAAIRTGMAVAIREWLDAQRYPQMTYHSSHIELDEQRGVASGDLTLHGITRPVVLTVTLLDCPTAPTVNSQPMAGSGAPSSGCRMDSGARRPGRYHHQRQHSLSLAGAWPQRQRPSAGRLKD